MIRIFTIKTGWSVALCDEPGPMIIESPDGEVIGGDFDRRHSTVCGHESSIASLDPESDIPDDVHDDLCELLCAEGLADTYKAWGER